MADEHAEAAVPAPPPRRRWLRRVLAGLAVTVLLLAATAALLYSYGSMWLPDPAMREAYAAAEAAGQVPPVPSRFHVPIPGCVCHSDDPVQTMTHSVYRISECRQCH